MAVALDKLIDLNLLSGYDANMKEWVNIQIENIQITIDESLPTTGEDGKVYITKEGIVYWDADSASYKTISNGGESSGQATQWEPI